MIDILDRNLDRLRPTMSAQYRITGWSNDDYGLMRETIYQLLRDTGRRPEEITALRRDCLDTDAGGDPVLIYTNSKAGRLNRRLHITTATGAVVTAWLTRITALRPDQPSAYLFPQVHMAEPHSNKHFLADAFGVIFRDWVDSIPELVPLLRTPSSPEGIIDRRDVVAYSLRHSYAKRHADARRRPSCFARSPKHRSDLRLLSRRAETKREAIERVGALVMDRRGALRPAVDPIPYERRSVSTLLGGCVEPSNVKSGGTSCPIRFQCGGCNHYRPDPSYIPEIVFCV